MKKLLLLFFSLLSLHSFSQTYSLSELGGRELHNNIRLNYILIDQPNRTYNYSDGSTYKLRPTMGLFGLTTISH